MFSCRSPLREQQIPTRLAQPLLPASYLLYLLSAFPPQPQPPTNWHEKNAQPIPQSPQPSALAVLLFSLPTPSRLLFLLNFAINTLLLAASADLAISPFFDTAPDVAFTRVGAVYPDSVKLLVRHPYPNDSLAVLYREQSNSSLPWKPGPTLNLTEHSDWAQTVRLAGLWPSTSYEYVIADSNRTALDRPIPFRTFPDPRLHAPSFFRFLATSCITPNFPYAGPFHRRTIPGFDHLADYLYAVNHTQSPIEFLLFLGDFIYADVPTYIGDDQEAYRRLYRRNYASPSFRKVYEQLPIIFAYDDHEFINNYGGNSLDLPPFANASNAYHIYAGSTNYDAHENYYDFQHGDIAFFVMDTRRYRSPPNTTVEPKTMLGPTQLAALHAWLHRVNTTHPAPFKFIVSSVPFTSLWTHDAQIDSWAGYADEKAALLAAFHSVPNLIVISGDRHEFGAVEFAVRDGDPGYVVREFSTSPLSMFYIPFVHTMRERSEAFFTRNVTEGVEEVPYEKRIAYIPTGNVKWSAFEVDTRDIDKPTLRLETVIDGKPAYHLEIVGTPVYPPAALSGLSSLVTTNVKGIFDRIGLRPSKWF
ncbi:hypothetical protein JR316_0003293 [Psilocybe cubensis]|uniref:PhoD-like phosphatase metallophosphatase domain-containing protein n=2 Tax=Psilocybe cubensis TaxID=181762 RepID=A0A8H7Y252_PSICU|nr:hypothetical protein JR316_0003293 [Psilocybe cubensis]KAH9483815.1 hypothetical protein JR316_0003293 [Psilocybe cubensis]